MDPERNLKLATTELSTGLFVSPPDYSTLPGNPQCDKERLKLLPEMKRIRLSQINYLFSLTPRMKQIAAEKGMDIHQDDQEALPEEVKQYWACFRAQDKFTDHIDYLKACKAQQGGWWFRK